MRGIEEADVMIFRLANERIGGRERLTEYRQRTQERAIIVMAGDEDNRDEN